MLTIIIREETVSGDIFHWNIYKRLFPSEQMLSSALLAQTKRNKKKTKPKRVENKTSIWHSQWPWIWHAAPFVWLVSNNRQKQSLIDICMKKGKMLQRSSILNSNDFLESKILPNMSKKTRRVIPKYKSLEINGKRQNDNLNRSK